MFFKAALSLTIGVSTLINAAPLAPSSNEPYRLVHQFPNNSFLEGLAVRSNGQLLVTNLDTAQIFQVDPFSSSVRTNYRRVKFSERNTTIAGITEVEDDVFYFVTTGNSDGVTFQFGLNTSAIYRIDLRNYPEAGRPKVVKVHDIKDIALPNGLTLLSKERGLILIADSAGLIWRFDVKTGAHSVAIDDPILKPVPGAPTGFGVNGIKVIGSKLYFTSLDQQTVGTFEIDDNANALGKPKNISSQVPNADDFAVGRDGSIWLAENVSNKVVRVFPNGTVKDIFNITGPVSARFGRLPQDMDILYVSTDGLLFNESGVPVRNDGKIVALDTTKYN